jgi:hypothetical protein
MCTWCIHHWSKFMYDMSIMYIMAVPDLETAYSQIKKLLSDYLQSTSILTADPSLQTCYHVCARVHIPFLGWWKAKRLPDPQFKLWQLALISASSSQSGQQGTLHAAPVQFFGSLNGSSWESTAMECPGQTQEHFWLKALAKKSCWRRAGSLLPGQTSHHKIWT